MNDSARSEDLASLSSRQSNISKYMVGEKSEMLMNIVTFFHNLPCRLLLLLAYPVERVSQNTAALTFQD